MTNRIEVKAKQAFYSDLTGARANGEIFQTDQDTFNKLQEAGYVQKLDLSAEGQKLAQEYAKSQQQMGQEQAKANEAVSQAHHVQNMEANQHTESINQEAAQRAQNAPAENQADRARMEQQANAFEPAATFNTKATAKKANDTK
jgi:hypothetical protein